MKKMINNNEFLIEADHVKEVSNEIRVFVNAMKTKGNTIRVTPYTVGRDYDSIEEIQHLKFEKKGYFDIASEFSRCISKPYFGRFDFVYEGEIKSCYIGEKDVDIKNKHIVFSKHSFVGIAYAYSSNPRPFIRNKNVDVCLRRGLIVSNAKLKEAYDNFRRRDYDPINHKITPVEGKISVKNKVEDSMNINEDSYKDNDLSRLQVHLGSDMNLTDQTGDVLYDPYLMSLLEIHNNSKELLSIFSSIQENQLNIVTKDDNDTFVVQGCAGSGKTAIMFERLQFLKYREKLNLDKTFIISPNENFTTFVRSFALYLGLERIKIISLNDYYIQVLNKYGMSRPYKYYDENLLNNEFLSKIYSKESKKMLENMVDSYYESLIRNFEKNLHLSVIKKYFTFLTGKSFINVTNKFDKLNKDLTLILSNLKVLVDELFVFLKAIHKSYKTFKQYFKLRDHLYFADQLILIKKNAFSIYSKYKELLLSVDDNNKELNNFTSYNDIQETSFYKIKMLIKKVVNSKVLNEELHKSLNEQAEYLDTLKDSFVNYEILLKAQNFDADIIDLIKGLNLLNSGEKHAVDNAIVLIKKAVAETTITKILKIISNEFIDNISKQFNLDLKGKVYQFSNYVYLILLNKMKGSKLADDYLIAFDEAQEYAAEELNLIKEINKNVSLNIFGDINQRSSSKGIISWTDIDGINDNNMLFLKENYRNPGNIVKFINKELNLNDFPCSLFIEGNIKKISDFDVIDLLHEGNYVVISKDLKNLYDLAIGQSMCLHTIKEREDFTRLDLGKNGPNYFLSPVTSKGQEYKDVIVLTKGMSKTDKYISFTRSKNNLYICDEI